MQPNIKETLGPASLLPRVLLPALVFVAALFYNGPRDSLFSLALAFTLLVLWLGLNLRTAGNFPLSRNSIVPLPAIAALYLIWIAVGYHFSIFPQVSLLDGLLFATLPLGFFGWLLAGTNGQLRWPLLWYLLVGVAFFLGVWGSVDFFIFRERAHGSLIDTNAYASVMNLFLVPLCLLYLASNSGNTGSRRGRWLLGLIVAFALFQAMTLSRGGTLALAIAIAASPWFCNRRPQFWRRLVLIVFVLVASHGLARLAAPDNQGARFDRLVGVTEKDPSVNDRLLIWEATWKMFLDNNVATGSGLGTFALVYPRYRPAGERSSGNFAHNDYLQALQEGGVVQFSLLVVLTVGVPLFLLARTGWSHVKKPLGEEELEAVGLLLGIVAVSAHAVVNFVHHILPIAFVSGLYLGRAWQVLSPAGSRQLPNTMSIRLGHRPIRLALYALLMIPALILVADVLVAAMFAGESPRIAKLQAPQQKIVTGIAISLRPANIWPRLYELERLLTLLATMKSPEEKGGLTKLVLDEIDDAEKRAPGLPFWTHLRARTYLMSPSKENLELARQNLEQAVNNAPQSPQPRLLLMRVLTKLGHPDRALELANEWKRWIELTPEMDTLHTLAEEARTLSYSLGNTADAQYWSVIAARASKKMQAME